MRSTQVIFVLATLSFGQSVIAQGGMGRLPPGDVNVTNDETSPVPVTIQNGGQSIVEYRYVGLTPDATTGRISALFDGITLTGYAAMNKFCEAEFGVGARAATAGEALFRHDADSRAGWVVPDGGIVVLDQSPTFIAVSRHSHARFGGSNVGPEDAYERAACKSYSLDLFFVNSATVTPSGFIDGRSQCADAFPIACSAPVLIPVSP